MVCGSLVLCAIVSLLIYFGLQHLKKKAAEQKWARWSNTPKDLVIFHGYPSAKITPHASPFLMKLATYLRMANIPHKHEWKDISGPKGRTPWITLNGEHLADSHFIIQFLNKKFGKKLSEKYSTEDLAVARALRVMLEERSLWGIAMERFVFGLQNLEKLQEVPVAWFSKRWMSYRMLRNTWAHGLGRHSEKEIVSLMKDDLRNVSQILGSKKYILGDTPCEEDCAIFAFVATFLWALPGSPYSTFLNDECSNLVQYCNRMKQQYWSDWDEICSKAKTATWDWDSIKQSIIDLF